jgi:hypothetical protein
MIDFVVTAVVGIGFSSYFLYLSRSRKYHKNVMEKSDADNARRAQKRLFVIAIVLLGLTIFQLVITTVQNIQILGSVCLKSLDNFVIPAQAGIQVGLFLDSRR